MGRYAGLARARQINAANELQLLDQQMNLARERERRGLQGLAMQRQAWQDQRAAEQDAFNRNRLMEQDRIAAEDRAWGRQVQQFGLDSQQMRNAMAMDEWQRGRQQYGEDRMKRLRDEGLADVLREAAVAGQATPETLMRVNGGGALKFAAAEFDPEQGVVTVQFADGSIRPFQPWEVSQIAGMPQAPQGPSMSDMTSRAEAMVKFANTERARAREMMDQALLLKEAGMDGEAMRLAENAQNILNRIDPGNGQGITEMAGAMLTQGRGLRGMAGAAPASAERQAWTTVADARTGLDGLLNDAKSEADAEAAKARQSGERLMEIGDRAKQRIGPVGPRAVSFFAERPSPLQQYEAMSPEAQQAVIAAAAQVARERGIPAAEAFRIAITQAAR